VTSAGPAPAAVAPPRWQVLSAVYAGVFLAAIDFYIVTVAVPAMLRGFPGSGIAEISWVFNGYTITYTAALLPAAGLADRFGRRRVFLVGIAVFALSALASATAPSAAALIAARLVQGAAGGTITPLALALILPHFPAERRGRAIGTWSATQSAAVAAGPSLGGVLVSAVGWRAVFALQVPVALVALAGAARATTARATNGGEAALDRSRPPDLLGVLLLVPGIGLPALAIVQSHDWGVLNWRTVTALAAGVLLGAMFTARSLRNPAPIIDLGLLRIRAVRRANSVMILTGLVMYALPAAAVLFLTGVWRYPAALAGLAVTPAPAMRAVAAIVGGRLCGRYGPRAVAGPGAALLALSTVSLLAVGSRSEYWAVFLPAVLGSGAGIGLMVISLSAAGLAGIPPERLASGTSMSALARAVGAVVSLAALALILSTVPGGTGSIRAYRLAWIAMAVISVVMLAASSTVPDRGDAGLIAPARSSNRSNVLSRY
jgi:EmrB/QacA subfamily drug resistance transporter